MKNLQDLKGILYQLNNNYDLKELTPKKIVEKASIKKLIILKYQLILT